MDPASAVEKWRRGARILALAALLASFFLPTFKSAWEPFLSGWGVFVLAFVSPQFFPAALATIVLPVNLIRGLRGATGRWAMLVTVFGALLAVAAGVFITAMSGIRTARLGVGY